MKSKTLKAATAATLLAAALVVAAPMAANAYTIPETDVTVEDPTLAPGGLVELEVSPGYFAPGSDVTISLTGENASDATLAFVKFAVETANLGAVDAAADGSLDADIRLPSDAIGPYTVVASGVDEDGNPVTATVAVSVTGAAAGGALPVTGGDSGALLGFWIGGGALLLAGGGLAVAGTVRRHRQQVAA